MIFTRADFVKREWDAQPLVSSVGWIDVHLVRLDAWLSAVADWIVDAHGYGKRLVVRANEMLTAFVQLERAIHEVAVSLVL
jgi:hypothetical protein